MFIRKKKTILKSIVILPACDNYSLYFVICLSEFIDIFVYNA